MSKEFSLEILTPARELLATSVTEVVLPAYDGERGILASHEDFIGILGTGAVKIVREGDDYWFMVSFGVYEVREGAVTLFAEFAETADEVDVDADSEQIKELEAIFTKIAEFDPEKYPAQKLSYDRSQARLEIHRRTQKVH